VTGIHIGRLRSKCEVKEADKAFAARLARWGGIRIFAYLMVVAIFFAVTWCLTWVVGACFGRTDYPYYECADLEADGF
jgi:hypothetical protein